jgi:predicted GTPase
MSKTSGKTKEKKSKKSLKKFLENSFKKEIEFFTQPLITDFNNYPLPPPGI